MSQLRKAPIYRVLTRHSLFAGGDRELMLLSGLVSIGLAVSALNWPAITAAVVILALAVSGLRKMAKADPQMRQIYNRYIKYRDYYPARSRPWRKDT